MGIVKEIQEGISDFGQIAVRPLLAILLGSSALIFMPDSMLSGMGVLPFVVRYRFWIGFALLSSSAYLLAHLISRVWLLASEFFCERKALSDLHHVLKNLTPEEQGRLKPYIFERKTTARYDITDGVVGELIAKGVLFSSTEQYNMLNGVPINILPPAREILQKHPEYLEFAVDVRPDHYGCLG